jgi:hypothetical protein
VVATVAGMEVVSGAAMAVVTATRISAAVIMAAGTLAVGIMAAGTLVDTLAAGRRISVHSPGRRSTATVHSRPMAMS